MYKHFLISALAIVLVSADAAPQTGDIVIDNCQIRAVHHQLVPASEAGALWSINASEGDRVKERDELARIDDREAQAMVTVRQNEYEVAVSKAESDVNIKHAQAAEGVARKEYERKLEVHRDSPKAVTQTELHAKWYEWKKGEFAIQQAQEDRINNEKTAKAKKAEVDAQLVNVERRILRAPHDGIVVRVWRQVGEWVNPGDTVVEILRPDRMRIHGIFNPQQWSTADVENREVTVEVNLAHGKTIKVPGKVVFVRPSLESYDSQPMFAEFDTPVDENGRPQVLDGMTGKMTIHTTRSPLADTRQPSGNTAKTK